MNFVEGLVGRHEANLGRVEHVDALHGLAVKTVHDAQRYAARVKTEAEQKTGRLTHRIVGEAQRKAVEISEQVAREIINAARLRAQEIEEKFQRNASERLAYIEAAISDMQRREAPPH